MLLLMFAKMNHSVAVNEFISCFQMKLIYQKLSIFVGVEQ